MRAPIVEIVRSEQNIGRNCRATSCAVLPRIEAARGERQSAEAYAGRVENSVADCGREADDGRFPGTGWRKILAVEENGFDFGNVAEARNAVLREMGIRNAAVFEFDRLDRKSVV